MKLFSKTKNPKANQENAGDRPYLFLENNNDRQPFDLANQENADWLGQEDEGQLSVDVYQTENNIIIKSTIAGVKPEDLDISVNNDMVTIRGKREQEKEVNPPAGGEEKNFFFQECYWGSFSRSIILPGEVKTDQVQANLKNGILTIILPKTESSKSVNIKVEEEEDD